MYDFPIFAGVQDISASTKRGLLEFSYQLSVGAKEEAIKAIKMIHNPAVSPNEFYTTATDCAVWGVLILEYDNAID